MISGSGDVKKKVYGLREAFGDFDKSPFRGRIFVVLDKTHQPGLTEELTKLGILHANIIIWPKNGIEYYYPAEILASIFACKPEQLSALAVAGDAVSLNGIQKTKNDLVTEVLRHIDASTKLPAEVTDRLLRPLEAAIT